MLRGNSFLQPCPVFCFVLFIISLRAICSTGPIDSILIKADCYFDNLNYDSAGYFYSIYLQKSNIKDHPGIYCNSVNKLVECQWRQERYDTARILAYQNLKSSIEYLGEDHQETARTYVNLGVLGFLLGNSGITHAYFVKALDIFNKNFGEQNLESAIAYEWLGIYHNSFSDTVNAEKYLWEALKIQKQLHTDNTFLCADLYRYIGLFYKRFSVFDSALFYYDKAKRIFDRKYTESNYKSIKCLNNIADVYEWFGEYDTVLEIHNRSLGLIETAKTENRYPLMMTYFNISELYSNFGDYENALKYMQKVLNLYYPDICIDSVFDNPGNVQDFNCSTTSSALEYKARYLYEIYKQNPEHNTNYLFSLYQCNKLRHKLIEVKGQGVNNIDELLLFIQRYNNNYIEFAENAFLVFKITGDTSCLSQALTYLSFNRSANRVLTKRVFERKYVANLPNEYLISENRLQKELNELLSQRLTIDKSDPIEPINVLIAEKKIEMDLLVCKMVLDNPGLMNFDFDNKPIYYPSIVNKLKDNQALVWFHEYCEAYSQMPDSILIIAISANGSKYFKTGGRATVNLINKYKKSVSGDFQNIDKTDSIGYKLYTTIFNQIRDIVSQNNLVIIPSKHISMIPFDALPVEPGHNPVRMINNYTIWNEFSILSFLQDDVKTGNKNNSVLAIAPEFNKQQKQAIALLTKRDTGLINLPGAKIECESIANFFDTKTLLGAYATRSAFETACSGYQIIHLSTHAIPDKNNPKTIRLVFSDYNKTGGMGSLDLFEVLNLSINAELVVLSACKTGDGEMSKGEGNINLAWAFNKAGAKSVLVSLWDANDYASSIIMPKFYKYLSEGLTKPYALRQAKLDFINSSDNLTSSPYFWAGFEYWGNNTTIGTNENSSRRILSFSLILFLIAITIFIIVKRKNRSHFGRIKKNYSN